MEGLWTGAIRAAALQVASATDSPAVPLLLKLVYTAYVVVLVPAYWRYYGPRNFLWFSDLGLFLTGVALWLESPLLASMQAISVALLDLVWLAAFLVRLLGITRRAGPSEYMFNPKIPRFIRGLSLFHIWLPFLQLWLLGQLGYDSRAWWVQTAFAWVVLPLCYWLTDPAENINWVFGPGNVPQRRIAPRDYLLLLMLIYSTCIYLPAALLFREFFPSAATL